MDKKRPNSIKLNHKWESIVAFDGEINVDLEDSDDGKDAAAVAVRSSGSSPASFLLLALVEQFCMQNEGDPVECRKLYLAMCKKLADMKIVSRVCCTDELSFMIQHAKVSLKKLFDVVLVDVGQKPKKSSLVPYRRASDVFLQPRLVTNQLGVWSWDDIVNAHTTRYGVEFLEVGKLGRGAYGAVFKAKHKLDGCSYAIKKIAFQDINKSICVKTLREVKYLASLRHENVVQYHGAWMEYQLPIISDNSSHSQHTDEWQHSSRMPALEYNADDSTSSGSSGLALQWEVTDSVVFEESKPTESFPLEDFIDSAKQKRRSQRSFRRSLSSGDKPYGTESVAFGKQYAFHEGDSMGSCTFIQNAFVMLYIQMELCTHTLSEWLKDRNTVPTEVTGEDKSTYRGIKVGASLSVLRGILRAIEYIHAQNVIHRDVKPKNIFISHHAIGQMKVKLGDFGLARQLPSTPSGSTTPLTPNPGHLIEMPEDAENVYTQGIGTTIYAAPEQLVGPAYSKKCDMYSVGLVMFELYQPFATEMERIHDLMDLRRGKMPPEFIRQWPVEQNIIQKLTSQDPVCRPTATELLEGELFLSKDQIIRKLHKQLESKDREITSLTERLESKEKELADLNATYNRSLKLLLE